VAGELSQHDRALVDTIGAWSVLLVLTGWAAGGRTDTDVWGHSTIGRWMIEHRAFLWIDPFSFTHDQPWVNHEWLWDVSTALIERGTGLPGLIALRALLIGFVLWRVTRASQGQSFPLRVGAMLLVAVGCIGQWQSMRPQLATLALYVITLERPTARWLPILFLVWANVHGGWIYGAALLGLYTLAHLDRRQLALAAACAAATLVNPYGWQLWRALFDATQRGWADVSEWAPIWHPSTGASPLVLWLLCVALVAWLARTVTLPRWQWLWVVVTFVAAARSQRLGGLAVLTATLFLLRARQRPVVEVVWRTPTRIGAAVVLALATTVGIALAAPGRACWPALEGVLAPEPEAVSFVRSADLRGRAVVHFNYGLYVIAHLHEQLQVSIDNRRETVYSDAVVRDHQRFNRGDDPRYPERLGADLIWLPTTLDTVIAQLEARGWHRRFTGPRTVLLSREPGSHTVITVSGAGPCYPL
jgi:hypothetical protein